MPDPLNIYGKHFFETICRYCTDGQPSKYDATDACRLLIEMFNPKRILDCGCATGTYAYGFYLLHSDIDIVGFDISDYALSNCIPEISDKLFRLDLEVEKIPYPDNSFDLVLCFDFLEHLHDDYVDFAISEIVRVASNIIFCRQPFCRFRCAEGERVSRIVEYNDLSNLERIKLIDRDPFFYTIDPNIEQDEPKYDYHPSERKRKFFLEKFSKNGCREIYLDEKYYKYPNPLHVVSWHTLVLKKETVGESIVHS